MPTINKFLQSLTKEQVLEISDKYLRGWVNIQTEYKIMLRGLNHRRDDYGLPRISRDQVFDYRDSYVKNHYSYEERVELIADYLANHKMDSQRGKGIFLFNCRFDVRYAKAFRSLIGKEKFDELSEKHRVNKMMTTQKKEYGGVGLASKSSLLHAKQTNLKRYGVANPMQDETIKTALFNSMLDKLGTQMDKFRHSHDLSELTGVVLERSSTELFVLDLLCKRFGYDDVYYQYGFKPFDKRYPFSCDFYIKSQDLFIELNYYYVHGYHWFDSNDSKDLKRLALLQSKDSTAYARAIETWTKLDVKKRNCAKNSKLNYLVFWVYPKGIVTDLKLEDLADLNLWLNNYNGDYRSFIKDHPENTY